MQTFESVNFEVEKDLKKPEYPLEKRISSQSLPIYSKKEKS